MEKVAVLLTYVTVCGTVKTENGVRPLLSQTCTQDRPCPLCCDVHYLCQSGLCQHVGHHHTYGKYFTGDLQAVTGLHMTGVLHRDMKPDNMLVVNNKLHVNDFDISCLVDSSDAALRMRVGTEDFWSLLWQSGEPLQRSG
ncbi:TPA: hypothetical protein ACH3X1_006296 [Trebouxia sp. C0004]